MTAKLSLLASLLALGPLVLDATAQTQVRINEVFSSNANLENPDGSVSDWVELINTSANLVNLGGTSLTDAVGIPRKWEFPAGVTIPPNGRLVVYFDSGRPATLTAGGILNTGFSLRETGDDVYFYGTGVIPAVIDFIVYGVQVRDLSLSRVPDATGSFALSQPTLGAANSAISLGLPNALRINEWMASPSRGEDWFELFNPGTQPVSLAGLRLTDTVDPHQMPPLSFIGADANGFVRLWASGSTNNADDVNFKLAAGGESIVLSTANGTPIDRVDFTQQTSGVSEGRLPDGASRQMKFAGSPTPGESNFIPYPGLVINELLAHTDHPLQDAVELFNKTGTAIDISGWWLSNRRTQPQRYQIPAGTIVPANGYLVLYESDFNGPNALSPFTFSAAYDDQVYLSQSVAGQLTGFRLGEEFEPSDNGISFGRVETSVPGDHKFVALTRPTFGVDNPVDPADFAKGKGAPNAPVLIGPVVVSEVMYHPITTGLEENIIDEYLEIRNITPNSVSLFDPVYPTNRWKFRDAVSYSFPSGTTLGPFAFALVVSFDPAIQSLREVFVAKYNVPAGVQIFGPYVGALSNSGDGVEFYRPDSPQGPLRPDAGFVPFLRVDKVNYTDLAPWPTTPDGTGHSLQKKNLSAFGNDPINWEGANPTAGRPNSPEISDTDSDGMPDTWEEANGFNKLSASDAGQDADNDQFTNVQEYLAGTNPRNAASRLAITTLVHDFASGGASLKVQFQAMTGKTYTVQYRNSTALSSRWQSLSTVPAGAERTVEIEDVNAAGRTDRYYRIVTP